MTQSPPQSSHVLMLSLQKLGFNIWILGDTHSLEKAFYFIHHWILLSVHINHREIINPKHPWNKCWFVVVQSLSFVWLFAIPSMPGLPVLHLSTSPGVCSNSRPLSRWCRPTISSSVIPFSSHLQSFPVSGSSLMSPLFTQLAKVLELQLQHQSFQWIFRVDFL